MLGGVSIARCETPIALAEDVARLHNTAFASDVAFRLYTASEMATLLAEDGQELWTVSNASGTLGYCRLECEAQLTWVEQIAVDPSLHGQGLGLALIYEALRGAGINRDHLAGLVVSSINGAARSMYQKLGFVVRRETRRYSAQQIDLNAHLSLIS